MNKSFRFGLETEYMLVNANNYEPLWYRDVTFSQLHTAFEQISLDGLPTVAGLDLEVYHTKIMPYTITGYPLFDKEGGVSDFFPKGAEIRTPICDSIDVCLDTLETLYDRMQTSLSERGMKATAISHHPIETQFSGPQGNRTHERWLWAQQVMTTYGPDINISLPHDLSARLDKELLEAKIDYYAAPMVLLSLASPFHQGKPWQTARGTGKSFRTFKRSKVAPALRISGERLEFKSLEMTDRIADFRNYTLLFLALLLDDGRLSGRGTRDSRVRDLEEVAQVGFEATDICGKLAELLEKAPAILDAWGFKNDSLSEFWSRLERKQTPADQMLQRYYTMGESIPAVMSTLTGAYSTVHQQKVVGI